MRLVERIRDRTGTVSEEVEGGERTADTRGMGTDFENW